MSADNETFVEHIPTGILGAAEAAPKYIRNRLDAAIEVEAIAFMPNIGVTANDTNYRTMAASVGGTALFTSVTTQTSPTGSGNLTAGTAVDFTLLSTAAARSARRLAAGTGVLLLNLAPTASGVAIDGVWEVRFRRVR